MVSQRRRATICAEEPIPFSRTRKETAPKCILQPPPPLPLRASSAGFLRGMPFSFCARRPPFRYFAVRPTEARTRRGGRPWPACAGQRTGSAYYCYYQTHLSCELRGLFSLHLGPTTASRRRLPGVSLLRPGLAAACFGWLSDERLCIEEHREVRHGFRGSAPNCRWLRVARWWWRQGRAPLRCMFWEGLMRALHGPAVMHAHMYTRSRGRGER